MSTYRHLRRADLFLVRVWREDAEVAYDKAKKSLGSCDGSDENDSEKNEWRGSVQRVVDGESHQFHSWQGLTDLLLAMVSNKTGR